MTQTWDVAVVGGGLAGLTAAASAADRGASVVLVDRDERGGRAGTDAVGRFLFNRGAHALFKGGAGIEVLARVGITPQGSNPALRGGRIRLDDRTAPFMSAELLGQRARIEIVRVLGGMWRWKPERLGGISAGQWLDDLDLSTRARQYLEMLIRTATYAADPYRISADVALQNTRTVSRHGVLYLDGGWEQLVGGLHHALKPRNVAIVHDRAIAIQPDTGHTTVVAHNTEIVAAQVVVATGGPDACASLLPERPATWEGLGPSSRIACLDLGLATDREVSTLFAIDRPLYLSRHAPPADLAPPGGSVVQLMRYLRPDEKLAATDLRQELAEHARLAGIDPDAAEGSRYLHEMVACSALPVPERGGLRGRPSGQTGLPGVHVAGDWVGPVGHLADASLASGEAAGAGRGWGCAPATEQDLGVTTGVIEEVFAAQRPRLLGLAYRITGSVADAEDVLQEAWLRMERTDTSSIADPTAWLVTVVSRLALDELKRAHRRREHYVGPWLPEPVPTNAAGIDPADTFELAESLTFAYLQLLDVLSPAERVAFLLADVFDVPFAGIAEILERSEASCRQLASRARRRIREKPAEAPRPDPSFDAKRFITAVTSGDLEGLMSLLAPDVVLTSDGGPLVRAARRPVVGAERVSRLILNLAHREGLSRAELDERQVNHAPGVVLSIDGHVIGVVAADIEDGLISALRIIVNPDKLTAFAAPMELR